MRDIIDSILIGGLEDSIIVYHTLIVREKERKCKNEYENQ